MSQAVPVQDDTCADLRPRRSRGQSHQESGDEQTSHEARPGLGLHTVLRFSGVLERAMDMGRHEVRQWGGSARRVRTPGHSTEKQRPCHEGVSL
jgi:hypothetical protein